MGDKFQANVLKKLLAGIPVNGHVGSLSGVYLDLAGAILAAPTQGEKAKAFEAELAGLTDGDQIRADVLAADPTADLDSWRDPIDIIDLPLTDAGNSEALAALHGANLRYDHRRGRWLIWKGNGWQPDQDGEIERLALATVRERLKVSVGIKDDERRGKAVKWSLASENRSRVNALIAGAQSMRPIAHSGEGWDFDPWLLGCSNGVVDLRTGDLRPGKRDDLITLTTGIDYNPNAKAPRFQRFLTEVFAGDYKLIEFIQRAAGYSLTGDIREHKLFLCWGKGANGKTTLFNALRSALGEYAATTPFTTFEKKKGDQTNDLAALQAMRFVTASETAEDQKLNEVRVKGVTGGDPVTCRFLFGEWFKYQPTYKIWLAMNYKPTIAGTDNGIWRRIRLIPFTESFEGREDAGLPGELAKEREGILAWAVRGALKWQADGLTEPKAVLDATQLYRKESDLIAQFLEDRTKADPSKNVRAGVLYQAFVAWCKYNGEEEITNTSFGRRMKERGIASNREKDGIHYLGIELEQQNPTI